MKKKNVLFLCYHNSIRSQIAEALLNSIYGNKYIAHSAGMVATKVDSYAIEVMKEIGIDISKKRSKSINEFQGKDFDSIVTVCNNKNEICPYFPGKNIIHKGFKDPKIFENNKEKTLQIFRKTRDDIKKWIINTFN
jgi:arsenate reductase